MFLSNSSVVTLRWTFFRIQRQLQPRRISKWNQLQQPQQQQLHEQRLLQQQLRSFNSSREKRGPHPILSPTTADNAFSTRLQFNIVKKPCKLSLLGNICIIILILYGSWKRSAQPTAAQYFAFFKNTVMCSTKWIYPWLVQ
jgi:hypothetical protein